MNTMYLPVGAFDKWKPEKPLSYDINQPHWAPQNQFAGYQMIYPQPAQQQATMYPEEDKSCCACAKALQTPKDWETLMMSFICPISSALDTANVWEEIRALENQDPKQAAYSETKQKPCTIQGAGGCCGYVSTAAGGIFLMTRVPDIGFLAFFAGLLTISIFPVMSICYLNAKVNETAKKFPNLQAKDRSKIHTPNCIQDLCCLMWFFPCYNTYLWKTGSETASQVYQNQINHGPG